MLHNLYKRTHIHHFWIRNYSERNRIFVVNSLKSVKKEKRENLGFYLKDINFTSI